MNRTSPLASIRRALHLASLGVVAVLAAGGAALAGIPFDGCGTIVQGVTCPRLFAADSGGTWLLSDFGTTVVGDYVRVVGLADPGCFTICQQGGCIANTSIGPCSPPCSCTLYCFGDGTGAACPCGNNGLTGNGCANSLNPNGAHMDGTGNSSIANDTVVLNGSGMPNSSALYFQGTTQQSGGAGVAFGDGKRCAGGTVVRLGTQTNVAGSSQYPAAGDPSISVRGGIVAPGSRTYQVWYRNAAAFCTTSTFNLSNAMEIAWGA